MHNRIRKHNRRHLNMGKGFGLQRSDAPGNHQRFSAALAAKSLVSDNLQIRMKFDVIKAGLTTDQFTVIMVIVTALVVTLRQNGRSADQKQRQCNQCHDDSDHCSRTPVLIYLLHIDSLPSKIPRQFTRRGRPSVL